MAYNRYWDTCHHDYVIRSRKWEQCTRCLRFQLRTGYVNQQRAMLARLDAQVDERALAAKKRRATAFQDERDRECYAKKGVKGR